MGWMFLWLGLAFGTQIWLCFRVGRSSVALAIATFFIGFPAALFTLFKHHGDEETTVTVPFIANVVFSVLFFVSAWQTLLPLLEAQEMQFEESVAAAAPSAHKIASATQVPTAAPTAAPASAAEPASSPAAVDPIDGFSAALRAAGLEHSVTRMAASASMPTGVAGAALFAVAPMGSASAAASAASAPGSSELSITLFQCESAAACRNLAGASLQQGGAEKRRVLQNGLLMLSMPAASADGSDLTPAAVASAFRKL